MKPSWFPVSVVAVNYQKKAGPVWREGKARGWGGVRGSGKALSPPGKGWRGETPQVPAQAPAQTHQFCTCCSSVEWEMKCPLAFAR
jgi:hypothetical protein